MYVKNHDGKHMTGDRIKILLLNLQKAESCDPRHDAILSTSSAIVFGIKTLRQHRNIVYDVVYNVVYDNVYDIVYDIQHYITYP
jgi:hypothetical protein